MNFICKRNLGYLKEFRKRQSSCQLPWLMINTGFDCELWKVKSVVFFPALAVQCLMRERVLTWLFQIYFLLHWKCAKLQIYYSVWKALFWAGVSFVASQLRVSQLWEELLCGTRARWGSSTVFGSPFWVIDQTFFLSWLWVSNTWKHLYVTFVELD